MAFIFAMRSVKSSSGHSRNASSGSALSAISEDGSDIGPLPTRSPGEGFMNQNESESRTGTAIESGNSRGGSGSGSGIGGRNGNGSASGSGRGIGFGRTPTPVPYPWSTKNFVKAFERSVNKLPPSYSFKTSSEADEYEKPMLKIRDKKQIARRGGWGRLAILAGTVLLCIIGLIVGLVLGLKKKNSNPSPSSPSTTPLDTTFPAGSYGIQTYLLSTSTNCTSAPSTWRCYPYSTYSSASASASASLTHFDWIIQHASANLSQQNYTVSSTNNPFSLTIPSTPLALLDSGLPTERYSFTVALLKAVMPSSDISGSNAASTCYFNSTVFEASLYTKMAKSTNTTSSSGSSSSSSDGGANETSQFVDWPFAVGMRQVAVAGAGTPECFETGGARIAGNFDGEAGGECSCVYQNYGL